MTSQIKICNANRAFAETAKGVFRRLFMSSSVRLTLFSLRSNLWIVSRSSKKLTAVTIAPSTRSTMSFSDFPKRRSEQTRKLRYSTIPVPHGIGARSCPYGPGLSRSHHFGKYRRASLKSAKDDTVEKAKMAKNRIIDVASNGNILTVLVIEFCGFFFHVRLEFFPLERYYIQDDGSYQAEYGVR